MYNYRYKCPRNVVKKKNHYITSGALIKCSAVLIYSAQTKSIAFSLKLDVNIAISFQSFITTRKKSLYAGLPVDKASIYTRTCSTNADKSPAHTAVVFVLSPYNQQSPHFDDPNKRDLSLCITMQFCSDERVKYLRCGRLQN